MGLLSGLKRFRQLSRDSATAAKKSFSAELTGLLVNKQKAFSRVVDIYTQTDINALIRSFEPSETE